MTQGLVVCVRHVRQIPAARGQLCARGLRAWFASRGLDYAEFVARGIPASELEATGDALAIAAVAIARNEAES